MRPNISYRFEEKDNSLDDFLARQRITGFLLIKDGKVLAERYQYDRSAQNRFVSHSMAKSIVSLAVGIALAERKIASLDDAVVKYVPKLAGNACGETTIRNILRMASGVAFNEVYDGRDDVTRFVRLRVAYDSIRALREFNTREIKIRSTLQNDFRVEVTCAIAVAERANIEMAARRLARCMVFMAINWFARLFNKVNKARTTHTGCIKDNMVVAG